MVVQRSPQGRVSRESPSGSSRHPTRSRCCGLAPLKRRAPRLYTSVHRLSSKALEMKATASPRARISGDEWVSQSPARRGSSAASGHPVVPGDAQAVCRRRIFVKIGKRTFAAAMSSSSSRPIRRRKTSSSCSCSPDDRQAGQRGAGSLPRSSPTSGYARGPQGPATRLISAKLLANMVTGARADRVLSRSRLPPAPVAGIFRPAVDHLYAAPVFVSTPAEAVHRPGVAWLWAGPRWRAGSPGPTRRSPSSTSGAPRPTWRGRQRGRRGKAGLHHPG